MHQAKVEYFKRKLSEAGIPQLPSKSHIVPIPIGNPYLSTWICNELLDNYGHYVQAINYPTVKKGDERLRLAPSPFHTFKMIDQFIVDFVKVYHKSGLYLSNMQSSGINSSINSTCSHCQKHWNVNEGFYCGLRENCPLLAAC